MNTSLFRKTLGAAVFTAQLAWNPGAAAQAALADDPFAAIEHEWQVIQYSTPESEREPLFAALADKTKAVAQQLPQRAESHIWEGIVLSSWAGAKGGLPAFQMVKQAKAEYETAIGIDPRAMRGSALSGLGVLYYRVPGWPVGFGNPAKAEQLFKQALEIDPGGLDPNYFYAGFLLDRKRYAEAIPVLRQALQARVRPGTQIADLAHKELARKMLDQAQQGAAGS